MTPLRPAIPSLQPQGQIQTPTAAADAARIAAQRAFFDAALGRAPATVGASSAPATAAPAAERSSTVRPAEPPPATGKIARPGSLLDIRV